MNGVHLVSVIVPGTQPRFGCETMGRQKRANVSGKLISWHP